ncbi:WYL domain-containing protein [Paracoccus sp. ME4]|uniref:WYL domain-containing protein n=1 Tax=Paracoccus sp. ME4 TaxID=3138066 RepID=UPI00398B9CD8
MKKELRYAWIESCYRHLGHLPKKALLDMFGTSEASMSADIRRVAEGINEAGGRVEIHAGRFVGDLPSNTVFPGAAFQDLIRSGLFGFYRSVDVELRLEPDPVLLGKVASAIARRQVIEAAYCAGSGRAVRRLSPHSIIEVLGRMHFRAYDHGKNAYSDFVFTRLEGPIRDVDISYVGPEMDEADAQRDAVTLVANAYYSGEDRAAIIREYGLDPSGQKRHRIRRSDVFYVRRKFEGPTTDFQPRIMIEE